MCSYQDSASHWQELYDLCSGPQSSTVQMVLDYENRDNDPSINRQDFAHHLDEMLEQGSKEDDFDKISEFIKKLIELIKNYNDDQFFMFMKMYGGKDFNQVAFQDLYFALQAIADGFRNWLTQVINEFSNMPLDQAENKTHSEMVNFVNDFIRTTAPLYYFVGLYAPGYIESLNNEYKQKNNEYATREHEEYKSSVPDKAKIKEYKGKVFAYYTAMMSTNVIIGQQKSTLDLINNFPSALAFDPNDYLQKKARDYLWEQVNLEMGKICRTEDFYDLLNKGKVKDITEYEELFPERFSTLRQIRNKQEELKELPVIDLSSFCSELGVSQENVDETEKLRFLVRKWLYFLLGQYSVHYGWGILGYKTEYHKEGMQQYIEVQKLYRSLKSLKREELIDITAKYNLPLEIPQ